MYEEVSDPIMDENEQAVARMLQAGGHTGLREWALACGYVYCDDNDEWYDDEGYCVDIEWKAIDEASKGGFFGTVGTSSPMPPLPPKECPKCGAEMPMCEGEAYEDGMYYVYMACRLINRCGATWTEQYAFVRTTDIRVPLEEK